MSSTDRIEKTVHLRAPVSRVWRALTTVSEFNTWFQIELEGSFEVGRRVEGQADCTGDMRIWVEIEKMEAERCFSFRWNPEDKPMEPEVTTLVEFRLQPDGDGTRLTVVESGFDGIPPERRTLAFSRNEEGWRMQIENIQRYVSA